MLSKRVSAQNASVLDETIVSTNDSQSRRIQAPQSLQKTTIAMQAYGMQTIYYSNILLPHMLASPNSLRVLEYTVVIYCLVLSLSLCHFIKLPINLFNCTKIFTNSRTIHQSRSPPFLPSTHVPAKR